jgi:hypothetical protein
MTTKAKHKYTFITEIDYSALEFNPDAPEPLPDGMFQYPIFAEIYPVLDDYLNTRGEPQAVFRSSNTFICYDPEDLNVRVGPDYYVAFNVDAPTIMRRRIYLPWEAGKAPDFVLEVGSESTGRQDMGDKREIYARIGIGEYWRFDSTGGEIYGEGLVGEELADGAYRRMVLTTEPDGVLKGYSRALGLWLCWKNGMLKFYNDSTGEYLASLSEERAARQQAEARVRQLEEELRRRR